MACYSIFGKARGIFSPYTIRSTSTRAKPFLLIAEC